MTEPVTRTPRAGERWESRHSIGHPLSDFVTIHHADDEVTTFRDWTGSVWANKTPSFMERWVPTTVSEAAVAQGSEQGTHNAEGAGSSPARRTERKPGI